MRAALALLACAVFAAPASAHCYSHWAYKTPQHCGVYARTTQAKDKNWYVELVTPPPLPKDERTPEQIADQEEHDRAVKAHHDEINTLMKLLRVQEGDLGAWK